MIVPALVTISLYFAAIALWLRLFAADAPPAGGSEQQEIRAALRRSIPVICLFALVLGGLWTGGFTATESAAAGAFGAFVAALLRGRLRGGAFWSVMEAVV